jgi:hypothetical protein
VPPFVLALGSIANLIVIRRAFASGIVIGGTLWLSL